MKNNVLNRLVGFYPTYFNRKARYTTTLAEFFSKEYAETQVITEKNFPYWVFKPYTNQQGIQCPPLIDPELLPEILKFMLEKSLLEIQEDIIEYVTYHGKNELYQAIKSLVGAVTISAVYDDKRILKNTYQPTYLFCIESDRCAIDEFKQACHEFGYCLYYGASFSHQGAFAIIQIEDDYQFEEHFAAAEAWFACRGIKIDYLSDRTRLRGWSFDPDAVFNEQAPVFKDTKVPSKKGKASKKNYGISKGPTAAFDTPGYVEHCHQLASKACGEFTGELHTYLQPYAAYFRNFGINHHYAVPYLWKHFWKDHPVIKATKRYNLKRFIHSFSGQYQYEDQFHIWQFKDIWVKSYATEEIDRIQQEIEKNHKLGFITAITGDTGIAKTSLAYALVDRKKHLGSRGVFAFPSNLAAEQKAFEFSYKENNPLDIALNVETFNQYTDPVTKKYLQSLNAVNIPHVKCEKMTYLNKDDFFFFDEVHKAIIDNYESTNRNVQAFFNSPACKVVFTGTPFKGMYKKLDIREVRVRRCNSPIVNLNTVQVINGQKHSLEDCQDESKKVGYNFSQASELMFNASVQYIEHTRDDPEGSLHLLYLQNTKHLEKMLDMFDERFHVQVLYSDDKIKQGALWKEINEFSKISTKPDKINIVIFTSLGYEAISIKNENLASIAIFGEKWPHNVEQIIGRPRNVKQINAYWFLPYRETKGYDLSIDTWMLKGHENYVKATQALGILKEIDDDSLYETGFNNKAIKQLEINAGALLNADGSFNDFHAVKEYFCRKNRWESNAQKFGYFSDKDRFNIIDHGIMSIDPDDRVDKAVGEIKLEKENSKLVAKQLLQENFIYCLLLTISSKITVAFKSKVESLLYEAEKALLTDPAFLAWKASISQDVREQIIHGVTIYVFLTKFFRSEKALLYVVLEYFSEFSTLRKQLNTMMLLDTPSRHAANIYNRSKYFQLTGLFRIGELYTRHQIKQAVARVFQHDDLVRMGLTKNKAVRLFEFIFDIEEKRILNEDTGKNTARAYKIIRQKTLASYAEDYGLTLRYQQETKQEKKEDNSLCKSGRSLEKVQNISSEMRKVQDGRVASSTGSLVHAMKQIKRMKKKRRT